MKPKYLIINALILAVLIFMQSGCALTRYEVTPQTAKGPQGGQVMLIEQMGTGSVEFVAKQTTGDEWLLQIFGYDKEMKPKMHYSSAKVEIITPDEKKSFVTLLNTKPYPWNRGVGHLENKTRIKGNEFKAHVLLFHGKPSGGSHVDFYYPFNGIESSGQPTSKG